jgi:hypothetical protein
LRADRRDLRFLSPGNETRLVFPDRPSEDLSSNYLGAQRIVDSAILLCALRALCGEFFLRIFACFASLAVNLFSPKPHKDDLLQRNATGKKFHGIMRRDAIFSMTTSETTGKLSRPTVALFFAGALIFLYLRNFLLPATPFLATGDQMLFFVRGVRVLHGQMPYRDFFELVTPGTDLFYAAIFRLTGVHLWVIQALGVVMGLAFCWMMAGISSRLFRGITILLPVLLFLVFDYASALDLTHHWYSTFFALATICALMEGKSLNRIAAAGVLCAVATLFTQTQGGLLFFALVIYVIWLYRRDGIWKPLAALVLPYALIVGCVLGYYAYRSGIHLLFFDLITFPLKYLSSGDVNSPRTYLRQLPPVHGAGDILRLIPFLFIYLLVPYVYIVGAIQLWRERKNLPASEKQLLVLLHLAGFALFLSVASGPRFFRLCTVAPPAILICVWMAARWKATRMLLWAVAALFAVLLPVYRQHQWHAIVPLPVGKTAFIDPLKYQEFRWLAQQTHPSEPFFNDADLGFYLMLENPAPVDFINMDDSTRPEWVAASVHALEQHPPRFVILYSEDSSILKHNDHSGPLRQYVHDHYRLAQTFPLGNDTFAEEVWERK